MRKSAKSSIPVAKPTPVAKPNLCSLLDTQIAQLTPEQVKTYLRFAILVSNEKSNHTAYLWFKRFRLYCSK